MTERLPRGDRYYYVNMLGQVCVATEYNDALYKCGNYFSTRDEAEVISVRFHAILEGAEVMEPWQKEKIETWDSMLETKDEISKNYFALLKNPKVKAVLSGADIINLPDEEEIAAAESRLNPYSDNLEGSRYVEGFFDAIKWFKDRLYGR